MSVPVGGLLAALAQVPDPRGRQGQRFSVSAMLAAVLCGLLSGMTAVSHLVQWLHAQPPEFWHLLGFKRRPPQETCFRDLLAELDPYVFERIVVDWLRNQQGGADAVQRMAESTTRTSNSDNQDELQTRTELEVQSIDGKTMRGSLQRHRRALHLLNLWSHASQIVQRQRDVGDTNEPKAAVEMFRDLLLKGQLIVGDALFCQREVCEQIVQQEGHYLLMVKDNQPTLHKDARSCFHDSAGCSPLRTAAT